MSWLNENKRTWRLFALGLLVVALAGPWGFERLHVPAEYACQPPSVRLEGDFCGYPLSGFWNLGAITGEFTYRLAGRLTGEVAGADLLPVGGIMLGAMIIILPILSTCLLILAGERRSMQIFNLAAWGLAFVISVTIGVSAPANAYRALWGLCLYGGLAAIMLVMEGLMMRKSESEKVA